MKISPLCVDYFTGGIFIINKGILYFLTPLNTFAIMQVALLQFLLQFLDQFKVISVFHLRESFDDSTWPNTVWFVMELDSSSNCAWSSDFFMRSISIDFSFWAAVASRSSAFASAACTLPSPTFCAVSIVVVARVLLSLSLTISDLSWLYPAW